LLLLAAAGANGVLAGASLDQSVKQLPARRRIGALQSSRRPGGVHIPFRRGVDFEYEWTRGDSNP
jgi:hypothetical protein